MTNTQKYVAAKNTNQVATKSNVPSVIHTDTKEQANSPDLLNLGVQAIKLINEGDAKRGKGIAIMTYVIAQAYYTKSFETVVSGVDSFTLEDMATGIGVSIDKEGRDLAKRDNKKANARLNVVAHELFGIVGTKKDEKAKTLDFFNASQKNSFVKALNLVHNLVMLKVRVSDQVQLDKDNNLCLPLFIFYKPSDKAHLKAQFEKSKYDITPISSYEDMLRNVDKLLTDAKLKNKRGTKQRTDSEKTMDSLGDIILKAKNVALELETGKITDINIDLRRKMQETLMAIQKAFDAEKKAIEKAEQAELAERQKNKKTA